MRRVLGGLLTALAFLLVWFALTAPDRVALLTPLAFVRLPVEAIAFVALVLVLPPRAARVAAVCVGLVLGVLSVLKLLDMAFSETLDRRFDSVVDWGYLGPLTGLVVDSVGRTAGVGVLASVAMLVLVLVVATPLAVLRLRRLVVRHRRASWRGVAALTVVWAGCAVLGLSVVGATPVASTSATTYAVGEVRRIPAEVADQRAFARATTAHDPLDDVPADRL
ncbi:MAG: hypothetical protein ABI776_10680, partial [Nocardioidaceae bacterium]